MLHTLILGAVALAPGNWLVWLIAGGLAGWIAGRLMGGGFGFLGDIIVGLIGAFLGAFIAGFFISASYGFIGTLIIAVIGAVILTAIVHAFQNRSAAV